MRNKVKKKTLLLLLASLAALTLGCITLLAADLDDHGVIVFQGKPTWVWAMRPSSSITPAEMPDATKLYTIYSNLGSKTDTYTSSHGWYVSGSDSWEGQQWMAMPFTPKKDATVTQIQIAVTYLNNKGGANGFELVLAADSAGLPGKTLHSWDLKNLPTFGTCCKLDTVKYAKGIKVKKGKQYWVIAQTDSKSQDAADVWNYTWNKTKGNFAFNQGNGWKTEDSNLCAFAVQGEL